MKIKAKQTRIPYSKEEKTRFFEEGMIRKPTPHKNKKKYDRNSFKKFDKKRTVSSI